MTEACRDPAPSSPSPYCDWFLCGLQWSAGPLPPASHREQAVERSKGAVLEEESVIVQSDNLEVQLDNEWAPLTNLHEFDLHLGRGMGGGMMHPSGQMQVRA